MVQFSVIPNSKKLNRSQTWILLGYEKEEGLFNSPGKEGDRIRKAAEEEGFSGKQGQAAVVHPTEGFFPSKVVLLGLGPKSDVDEENLRRAGGRLARKAREIRLDTASIDWPRSLNAGYVKAFAEGLILGAYQFNRYKTQNKETPKSLESFVFRFSSETIANMKSALQTAGVYCQAVILARDLVNGAPSDITPKVLADQARKLAKGPIHLRLYSRKELKRMGAGGILGVNNGSAQEPFLIHLHYKPTGKHKKSVAIVGKGITFDSGGLSLKSAGKMETMKSDMSGAAAVLGVFSQLSKVRPQVEVHGIIPTTENMPGGRACKPGDVLKALNGKTMEVLNTDAEGRLILSDALSYANKQKVDEIVDLATLTGACVTALGSLLAGAMTNNSDLFQRLKKATDTEGEPIWELPLVKEYKDDIKSKIADIKNTGSGEAGSIIGGLFLQEFVGETPWVHLDIAGPAFLEREFSAVPYLTFGGTGVIIRSLLTFLKNE